MDKRKWIGITFMTIIMMIVTACSLQSDLEVNTTSSSIGAGKVTEPNVTKSTTEEEHVEDLESEQASVESSSKNNIYLTTGSLNMREGASIEDQIITTIPEGEEVTYISAIGTWYKVVYGVHTGYVSSDYLIDLSEEESMVLESEIVNDQVPILMYHAIDEYKGNGIEELYVTPENFEIQMRYLKEAGFTPITFDDLHALKDIKKPILITLDDGYQNNINAYNILKKLNNSSFQAKAVIFMIGKKIDTKSGLSSKQLKEMSDSGIISIQSHTETHQSLPTVTNFEEEFGDIKKKLEGITGKRVTAIAYPSGHYDERVLEETKKYYDYAVTTKPGVADLQSSLHELRRIRISYKTTLSEFKNQVNQ
ncbi:polysaccharide deacetylase family protein [Bacillus niameyensis]|uniref:polysaccharide deacetylase family protein n=1 Tax=Bacillus niameyensis TaxID=1522308 RepID=UPI0007826FEA|nr:polysaccharide deacetylase family protein [Bacillus niameyensis]